MAPVSCPVTIAFHSTQYNNVLSHVVQDKPGLEFAGSTKDASQGGSAQVPFSTDAIPTQQHATPIAVATSRCGRALVHAASTHLCCATLPCHLQTSAIAMCSRLAKMHAHADFYKRWLTAAVPIPCVFIAACVLMLLFCSMQCREVQCFT